jgi:hypothetical protein
MLAHHHDVISLLATMLAHHVIVTSSLPFIPLSMVFRISTTEDYNHVRKDQHFSSDLVIRDLTPHIGRTMYSDVIKVNINKALQ